MALTTRFGGTAVSGAFVGFTKLTGLAETQEALRAFGERATHELAGALYRQGEAIMAESKLEVPVDTGVLRSTGHVAVPVITGTAVMVEMGYGGPATPYALRQHEELTWQHPSKERQRKSKISLGRIGKAKYLEDPFRRHAARLDADMAADLRSRLGAA
jgi:hypothetical protein